jgi:hypothetical protein
VGSQKPDGKIGPPNSDNRIVLRGFGRIMLLGGSPLGRELRDRALISPEVRSGVSVG